MNIAGRFEDKNATSVYLRENNMCGRLFLPLENKIHIFKLQCKLFSVLSHSPIELTKKMLRTFVSP